MYRREGPTCLGRLTVLVIGVLGILLVLWGMGVIDPLNNLLNPPQQAVNAPGPAIVQQLRARNEWITFSYQADQVIEGSREGNFFQNLLYGDRILLQARAEIGAGIDMSQLDESQVQINGTAISIVLPPAQIIYSRLDNEQTRIYDRQQGWLSRGDVNLETNARIYAERSILEAACESNILDRAAISGQENITDLLKATGFTEIDVQVSKVADCVGSANSVPEGSLATPEPTNVPEVPEVPSNSNVPTVEVEQPEQPQDSNSLSGTAVPLTPQP